VHAKTVVIADDTAFVRDRFASALVEAGLRALPVASTADLLSCLRAERGDIDLIVLDLQLPPARGTALVRVVRERAGDAVPILVFSGTLRDATEVRALAGMGVAGYINEYSAPQHIVAALAPHLFPEKFDRRDSPRVVLSVPVSYRTGTLIASGVTLTLGKGGLGVRTMSPLPVGAVAHLRFRLPGATRDIEADARVAWANRNSGMGLQFERLSASDQSALDEFVDGHFFTNRRA
jgi:uncharacterized protein (TIGR02266 family)